jgi:hypothetical protein
MADFCKQCSIELFDKDFRDLAGISTQAQTDDNRFALVLCEGCGFIQVDHEGRCVSHPNVCEKDGHEQKRTDKIRSEIEGSLRS